MVLVEVPLWVAHGNADVATNSGNGVSGSKAGMLPPLNKSPISLPSGASAGNPANDGSGGMSGSMNDKATQAAKSAMALLQSTRGGSNRAPMYSLDVHPDGTRFATAAGDGTVRVWSLRELFGGALSDTVKGSSVENSDDGGKKSRNKPTSRFTEEGNFVSSNTEDNDDDSSSSGASTSSASKRNGGDVNQPQRLQTGSISSSGVGPQLGVNDLSGFVRKKKGGTTVAAVSARVTMTTAETSESTTIAGNLKDGYSAISTDANANAQSTASAEPKSEAYAETTQPNPKDKPKKLPKLLATISSHEGSVLSVRFSPSGTYLATAGDDSYINIYKRSSHASIASKGNLVGVDSHGNSSLGRNNSSGGCGEDVEHWNRIAICRGHHLDVVGLAWAPDDSHLVSCSLDSVHPVIVWRLFDVFGDGIEEGLGSSDVGKSSYGAEGGLAGTGSFNRGAGISSGGSAVHIYNLHPFKVLGKNIHTSTVKGVAFDPAGKYIATSGDDPAVCIWRAFDDWGLEARIDSSSGVFRSKKRKRKVDVSPNRNNNSIEEEEEDDPGELASLSLFRRISFAPDGSHVCGTNATLRGKNIAAMISREGWAASGPRKEDGSSPSKHPPGAANLVGHKQPVVSSRHCPIFFQVPSKSKQRGGSNSSEEDSSDPGDDSDDDDPDAEPEYATLVALGDKRGFVTVWSTKSSRPLFKMQCSESRCTVTDISWGLVRSKREKPQDHNGRDQDSLVMLVSLLDGYVVALRFAIPEEVGGGNILSEEKTRQIFRSKYGIEDVVGTYGVSLGKRRPGKRLVDDSGPVLIENALQMTMEMEDASIDDESLSSRPADEVEQGQPGKDPGIASTVDFDDLKESHTSKTEKKRIRPALMNGHGGDSENVGNNVSDEDDNDANKKRRRKNKETSPDLLQNALDVAGKAASIAETAGNKSKVMEETSANRRDANLLSTQHDAPSSTNIQSTFDTGIFSRIPYNTKKVHTIELVSQKSSALIYSTDDSRRPPLVADCTNSNDTVSGGPPSSHCAIISISRGGKREWKDIITKTTCTALAADDHLMAIGTADGCLHLFGTSPSLGWDSGKAFRAFPPFVLGSPVVEINFGPSGRYSGPPSSSKSNFMVVVTSDGGFCVYEILSTGPKMAYKGSILPPMQQMCLSSGNCIGHHSNSHQQPRLARIVITESNYLMLILALPTASSGRVLQGLVYNRDMESWMRISDSSAFLLSEYYTSLPTSKYGGLDGALSKLDKLVNSGGSAMTSAKHMFLKLSDNEKSTSRRIVTRSHCEDRLACSVALGSAAEFEIWISLYARHLAFIGDADTLRFLVDILLGAPTSNSTTAGGNGAPSCWWFVSIGVRCLGLDSKRIIRKSILPEMSKNRALQRLSNEMAMELDSV